MPPAEQQTPVTGHHQHLGPDIHPWGERPAEEPLGPENRSNKRFGTTIRLAETVEEHERDQYLGLRNKLLGCNYILFLAVNSRKL